MAAVLCSLNACTFDSSTFLVPSFILSLGFLHQHCVCVCVYLQMLWSADINNTKSSGNNNNSNTSFLLLFFRKTILVTVNDSQSDRQWVKVGAFFICVYERTGIFKERKRTKWKIFLSIIFFTSISKFSLVLRPARLRYIQFSLFLSFFHQFPFRLKVLLRSFFLLQQHNRTAHNNGFPCKNCCLLLCKFCVKNQQFIK